MTRRPRLLDLFSCAGGAAMGYHRAGFDVTGIDNRPQPNYPFDFHQADALTYLADHGHEYDAIHASPPCQRFANVTAWRGIPDEHPDLVDPTRQLLIASRRPYIIENVPEAPLRIDVLLCGSQFGLHVRRHRIFESNAPLFTLLPECHHRDLLPFMHKAERAYADAMDCRWMTSVEARQAIPPAYTHHLGEKLLDALQHPTRP